jgi:hypothetical protein
VRPWQVAAVVLLAYVALLGPILAADGVRSALAVGSEFVDKSFRSARISAVHPTQHQGYDGQFAYFIALDPLKARYYIDNPPYRYGRILYPATAWALAAGRPGALPYTFVAVNIAAVAGAVWLLAAYLRRHRQSPWWAAVYGFFPGLYLCVRWDLTEPLALFMVAAALVVLDRYPERPLLSAPFFALAALGREVTLVFLGAAVVAVALRGRTGTRLAGRSMRNAGLLAVIGLVPFVAYHEVLQYWLGSGYYEEPATGVPFGGFTAHRFDGVHANILFAIVIPGVVWLALGVWAASRRGIDFALALVILTAALFVVWLPKGSYVDFLAAIRASTALVLVAVLAVPTLLELHGGGKRVAGACLLMLTPLWLLCALVLATVT